MRARIPPAAEIVRVSMARSQRSLVQAGSRRWAHKRKGLWSSAGTSSRRKRPHRQDLGGARRATAWNRAQSFGCRSALVRDVIAVSSELPGASGANTAMAAGGAAMGAGTVPAAVAGGGFRSLLDGCLDCGGDQPPAPEPRRAPGGKKPNSGTAAPTAIPVPAAATALRTSALGLGAWGSPGETTAAVAQEVDAVSARDLSGAGGSAPDPAPLPGWAQAAGRLAWDLPLPPDAPAAAADRDQGPGARPAAAPELAFAARLLPPEPAPPSHQAAEGLPGPASAAVSGEAAASSATDPRDRSMPAESVEAQPGHAGIPEPRMACAPHRSTRGKPHRRTQLSPEMPATLSPRQKGKRPPPQTGGMPAQLPAPPPRVRHLLWDTPRATRAGCHR